MRKVEIRGYVIYDPNELYRPDIGGPEVCSRIENLLFNEDYPREWSFEAVSDVEVDYVEEAK